MESTHIYLPNGGKPPAIDEDDGLRMFLESSMSTSGVVILLPDTLD